MQHSALRDRGRGGSDLRARLAARAAAHHSAAAVAAAAGACRLSHAEGLGRR